MITAFYKKIFLRAKDPTEKSNKFIYDLSSSEKTVIHPGERKAVQTSLLTFLPEGYFGIILPKKDLYIKYGINVLNDIIEDNNERELVLHLHNTNFPKDIFSKSDHERFFGEKTKFEISVGDKIAQIIILPKIQMEWKEML